MAAGDIGRIAGSFDPEAVQYMPFDQASGGATASFSNSFSSYLDVNTDTTELDANQFAMIGGDIRDGNNNMIVDGTAYTYQPTGTDLTPPGYVPQPGVVDAIEENTGDISQFTTLTADALQTLRDGATASRSMIVDISVISALSNVDRKDGASPTASVGEGMLNIRIMSTDMSPDTPDDQREIELNTGKGNIFAMKRTVSE